MSDTHHSIRISITDSDCIYIEISVSNILRLSVDKF